MPPREQQAIKEKRLFIDESSSEDRALIDQLEEWEKKPILSKRQEKIISLVQAELNNFCSEHDIKTSLLPKTYYLTEAQWGEVADLTSDPEILDCEGLFYHHLNIILRKVRERQRRDFDLIYFVDSDIHERIHQMAYRAVQVWQNDAGRVSRYFARSGLVIKNIDKEKEYSSYLDEAIVSYLAGKLTEKVVNKDRMLFEADLDRVWRYRNLSSEKLARKSLKLKKRDYSDYGYKSLVDVIRRLIGNLANLRDGDKETVERIFINAEFKGNLLDLAKEISKLYGKGGLRVLAHLDEKNTKDMLKFVNARGRINQAHYAEKILPPEEFERYCKIMEEKKEEE